MWSNKVPGSGRCHVFEKASTESSFIHSKVYTTHGEGGFSRAPRGQGLKGGDAPDVLQACVTQDS